MPLGQYGGPCRRSATAQLLAAKTPAKNRSDNGAAEEDKKSGKRSRKGEVGLRGLFGREQGATMSLKYRP